MEVTNFMASLFSTIALAISWTFYLSVQVGQIIVSSTIYVFKYAILSVAKILAVITVLVEDFHVFLFDVVQQLRNLLGVFTRGIDMVISFMEKLTKIPETVLYPFVQLYTGIEEVITAVFTTITSIFILSKQMIMLFGEGCWFLFMLFPRGIYHSIIALKDLVVQFPQNVINYFIDKVLLVVKLGKSGFDFVTDVTLEAFLGLLIVGCFIYILVHFYLTLYVYLKGALTACIRRSIYIFNLTKRYIVRKLRLLCADINGILLRSCRLFSNNSENDDLVERNSDDNNSNVVQDQNNTKFDIEHVCVVCQDNRRNVLLFPCRHLCLCSDCTRRLMRVSRQCPLCRNPIRTTMKVYV